MLSSANILAQEANKEEAKSKKGKVRIMVVEDENGQVNESVKEYDFNNEAELKEILENAELNSQNEVLKTKLIELSKQVGDEADHKLLEWIEGEPDSVKTKMIMMRFEDDATDHDFDVEDIHFEFKIKTVDSLNGNVQIEELMHGDSIRVKIIKEGIHLSNGDHKKTSSFVFIRRIDKTEGNKSVEDEGFGSSLRMEKIKNMPVEELSIYPNPTQGAFTTEFNVTEASDVLITVTDTRGAQIYTKELSNFEGRYREQVDLSAVESGLYFFNLQIGSERETHKIVVQ